MTRAPFPLPQLVLKRRAESIDRYEYEDFAVEGYQAHPHIKGEGGGLITFIVARADNGVIGRDANCLAPARRSQAIKR